MDFNVKILHKITMTEAQDRPLHFCFSELDHCVSDRIGGYDESIVLLEFSLRQLEANNRITDGDTLCNEEM
uniref:Uncharacterized protein n=1 Tax=Aegilops tauschii subsp. strangulata TaxID=200361 RepID=A0A452ZF53_AEGTS